MKKINIGLLILALMIPLLVGGISAALSMQGMAAYQNMKKPPLSPPAWVFPVAWTILYLMMGLSSYYILVSETNSHRKVILISLYVIQLTMNFMWSIIFFKWNMYLAAFIWLVVMWGIVIFCTFSFYQVSKIAAYLLIPYSLWLTFAAYLNLGSYILN